MRSIKARWRVAGVAGIFAVAGLATARAEDLPRPVQELLTTAQRLATQAQPNYPLAVERAKEAHALAPVGAARATAANLLGQILAIVKEPEAAAETFAEARAQLGPSTPATLGLHVQLENGRAMALADAAQHEDALRSLAELEALLSGVPAELVKVWFRRWQIEFVLGKASEAATAAKVSAAGDEWKRRLEFERGRKCPCLGQGLSKGGKILIAPDGTPLTERYFFVDEDVGGWVVYNDGRGRGLLGRGLLPVTGPIYYQIIPRRDRPGRWVVQRKSLLEPDAPIRFNMIDELGRPLLAKWVKSASAGAEGLYTMPFEGSEPEYFDYDGKPMAAPPPAKSGVSSTHLHADAGEARLDLAATGTRLLGADGTVLWGGEGWTLSGGEDGVVIGKLKTKEGEVTQVRRVGRGKHSRVVTTRADDEYAFAAYDLRARKVLVPEDRGLTHLSSFVGGRAIARKAGKYGVLARDGSWSIEPRYEGLTRQTNGLGWLVTEKVQKDRSNGVYDQTFETGSDKARPDTLRYRFLDLQGKPLHDQAWAFATSFRDGFAEVRVAPENLSPRAFGRYGLPWLVWTDARGKLLTPPGRVRLLDSPVSVYVPEEWATSVYQRRSLSLSLARGEGTYPYQAELRVKAAPRGPGDTYEAAVARAAQGLEKSRNAMWTLERLPDAKQHGRVVVTFVLKETKGAQRTISRLVFAPDWLVEVTLTGFEVSRSVKAGEPPPPSSLEVRAQQLVEDLRFRGDEGY